MASPQAVATNTCQSGVRQGCPLPLTLFNFAVDWILRNAMAGVTGVKVSTTLTLMDLAYADDIAILGDSYEAVQEVLNGVHRFAYAVGLRINATKTKVLSAQMSPSSRGTIILNGVPLEEVSSFI